MVVADHPSRTTGFATVATNVATQLHRRGWTVRYLGLGPTSEGHPQEFLLDGIDTYPTIVRHLVAEADHRPLVLTFGRADVPLKLDRALRDVGVRDLIDITCYAAAEHTLPPDGVRLVKRSVDRIVPATHFTAEALGLTPIQPIPHGVDSTIFRPRAPARRDYVRRQEFGAGPNDFVVGYVGRNSGHKRPDLALRAFAHMATGAYALCDHCQWLTVAELAPDGSFVAPPVCRHCSSKRLSSGKARERTLMVMHTELLDQRCRSISRGYDLELLACRFGVFDRVQFDRTLEPGSGHPVDRLADRMAALDVHVLLHSGAGWDLTILETAACGVPNVVTDYAGPAEYARAFSHMVPVASQVVQPWGIEGIADLDVAVAALIRLADDPVYREALGREGPETAAQFGWEHVGALWHELLLEITMRA